MNALTFTIKLLEPMLATGLEGDPNTGISMHYIAGSVLRGAIIKLYQNDRRKTDKSFEIDSANDVIRNLFFNGKVCFLNAYPLVKTGQYDDPKRSFPIPFSWHKEKDQEEKQGKNCYDFAKTSAQEVDPNGEKQFKGLNGRFFAFKDNSGNNIIKAEIKTRIAVHTQRDVAKGRATKENGAVFRYESVEKGAKFGGVIVSNEITFLNTIKPLLENVEISIGGSRTGGYGRARISVNPTIKTNYQETKRWMVADIENAEFTVTLLSNALIRDENGQLQSEFKLENAELIEHKTFKKLELVGGFNRKWGMTLPQMQSIKAGSIFTFKAISKIEKTTIENWLENGIGERRLDGFGRITVKLNTHKDLSFADEAKNEIPQVPLVSPNGLKNAQVIVNRIFKQKLDTELLANLSDYKAKIDKKNNH